MIEPIPAAVYGKFIKIGDDVDGKTFYKKGDRFISDLDESEEALAQRIHDYGHLHALRLGLVPDANRREEAYGAWSESILDNYVNAMLRSCDIHTNAMPIDISGIDVSEIGGAVNMYMRAAATDDNLADEVRKIMKGAFPYVNLGFADECISTIKAMASVYQALSTGQLTEMIRRLRATYPWHIDRERLQPTPQQDRWVDKLVDLSDNLSQQPARVKRVKRVNENSAESAWGKMYFYNIPLNHRHVPPISLGRATKKSRATFVGAFRYPHRANLITSDGRCFGLKRRIQHGTVLVDCSASMGLDTRELVWMLDTAPATTVAVYSGCVPDLYSGRLVIVARNHLHGSMQHARSVMGMGNVIDGPALDWLATQPKPRLWISDGGVTGIKDGYSPGLDTEARSKCKQHDITRLPSVDRAVLYFQELKENAR